MNKYTLTATIALLAIFFTVLQINDSHHLTINADFSVKFESISSILRTNLSAINTINDTIFVGDSVGSISIWNFDQKKKKIQYNDISRSTTGYLPPENNVVQIQATDTAAVALTADGHLTSYALNSAQKIIGSLKWDIQDSLKKFSLIFSDKGIFVAGITVTQKQLCVYKIGESLIKANPITKLVCNQTKQSYEDISYDKNNSLIATGNKATVYIFRFNDTDQKNPLSFLCRTNMPAVTDPGYKNMFSNNGTLVAINDLWVTSIFIDVNASFAKVVSAQRTQKLVKSGGTDAVSINKLASSKQKNFMVLINAKNKMQTYQLQTNNKLQYISDSRVIGKSKNFVLRDSTRFFSTQSNQLLDATLNQNHTNTNDEYIKVEATYTIVSANHFKSVKVIDAYNDIMITGSQGGKTNVKIWRINNSSMTLIDQKSLAQFSLLKSGYLDFECLLFLPPNNKTNANATLNFALAGGDPFKINLLKLSSTDYKIKQQIRSNDSHYKAITGLFLSPNKQYIITTSMDTTIYFWTLQNDRFNITKSQVTLTKMGPISHSVQDKSKNYFILGHDSTFTDKKSNISIWKIDEKKAKLEKVCQNVPGQAHQDNITSLLLTNDQKYIISLSDKGQIRLWRHVDWTMVDLLASLVTGIEQNIQISNSGTNKLIVETASEFSQYVYDFNGFVLVGNSKKQFNTKPKSSLIRGNKIYSGDEDGSIRTYQFRE